MRLLIQRASRASVTIEGQLTGEIGQGLVVFVGLGEEDTDTLFEPALEKISNLRIFPDDEGKMNLSVLDIGGGLLVISQFTLYADCRKGRRPSYIHAMPPPVAEKTFNDFYTYIQGTFPGPVAGGQFGAMMDVELVNAGPVTIWLDSSEMNWGRK